jgi:hypothetical protein
MLGGCLLDYCFANGDIYENSNSARGGREGEIEGERPLAVADVAPAAAQFIARSLYYYYYMLLGTENIHHASTGGPGAVYTRMSVRLEPGEVMKTNEAATKADLANQLN